jgi:predicted site-specific integrase-resolvase
MARKERMFTAVKFAEQMRISYPTVVRWLKRGLVPGARLEETPAGSYWQIPESAMKMERPKVGRRKATKKGQRND